MYVHILPEPVPCGRAAAQVAEAALQAALADGGRARMMMASAASQFAIVESLSTAPIDWPRVTVFHLDEYVGFEKDHPASFRRFLHEQFLTRLPAPLEAFCEVQGEVEDVDAELARLTALLAEAPVHLACIGMGENGHIAFNEPPTDFETKARFFVAALDEVSRRQQVGEGWFATLDDVPRHAISMTVPQIMEAETIVCTVPDARKAEAVRNAIEGPVTPNVPASILQRHPNCHVFLDEASAALLTGKYDG